MNRAQRKSYVVRAAQANRRLEQLRQHSAAGTPLRDAAETLGITFEGAKTLLKRMEGSARWPMKAQ